MPTLTIQRRQRTKFALPYWVFVNEQPVGIMRTPEVHIAMPSGSFNVAVRLMFSFGKRLWGIGGERVVTLGENDVRLRISDHERWWNLLFDIDLVVWLASFFFTLPHPWNIVYEVLSNGFFAVWILRIWFKRKTYFILTEA